MQDSPVSQIKDRLDIVDVVGSYVKLQKAGINYKGRCPFHNEKTPSFFVTPERQIWHCFGCAKGGDMFEFVKEIEGVDFPEALKILAAKAGIRLPEYRGGGLAATADADAKARLYEITERATKFFEKQFQSSTGKQAYQYLQDRGLAAETIKEFRLGFAPHDWEALSGYLIQSGYTEKEVVDAGLAIRRDPDKGRGGGIYDRFRSRIIFPICDISGQVVGFTGRVFEIPDPAGVYKPIAKEGESMAKYINTPGTLIYDKSRILYGLNQAKADVKRADRCILVEGNMDALMSFQAGVRNVVASSGTALTSHHLRLLQRYTKKLGFCFDSDTAGALATRRGIGLALAQQCSVSVVELNDPECKDPADFVKRYGSIWTDVVSAAKPVIQYYFDVARIGYNPSSVESKQKIIASVGPFIKRLTSSVERSHWIAQVAALVRVSESAVAADIAALKDDLEAYDRAADEAPVTASLPAAVKPDNLNETVLAIALARPAIIAKDHTDLENMLDPLTARAIAAIARAPEPFDFNGLISQFSESEKLHLEFARLRSQELWRDFSDADLAAEWHSILALARRRMINTRLVALQFDLREAEAAKDSERLARLASEFNTLAYQLIPSLHVQKETQKTSQKEAGQKSEEAGQNSAAPDGAAPDPFSPIAEETSRLRVGDSSTD